MLRTSSFFLRYQHSFFKYSLTMRFCQAKDTTSKQQVLKTYLQVIPPYKLQNIFNRQNITLQNYLTISRQRKLSQQQIKGIYSLIKKNVHMMPIQNLTLLLEHMNQQNTIDHYKSIVNSKKIYTKILTTFRKKIDVLPLEMLVNFIYKLVKMNKKQFQLMKQVENVIIQDKIQINPILIKRILWAYTHLDVGSSVLYSHVSKTIKIGQHQLSPLQLAEYAYMLSKVSQNAKGGYGVFAIAEKHIEAHLPRMKFSSLVKVSQYMLSQNLGSNSFQLKLEEQIYNKYPAKDSLKINELVSLLKSTSVYYFKFKECALLHMLRSSTQRLTPESMLQQFEDIIWSWGRAKKGDRDMWQVIQKKVHKFINLLKPRQIAFFYYSLSCSEFASQQTLQELQNAFMKLDLQQINEHYLLKFLLGMEKRKDFNKNVFTTISEVICRKIIKLTNRQFVMFIKILNESDIDYHNKQNFTSIIESLQKMQLELQKKMYMLRLNEISEALYLWIKLDLKGQNIVDKMFSQLDNVAHIPKSAFIKSLFCFTLKDRYEKTFQMLPILYELMKYGPIGYFFSPYQLPLLAYCVFHIKVNGKGKFLINPQLLQQLSQYMKETNPEILNQFIKKAYEQTMNLIQKYEKKKNL